MKHHNEPPPEAFQPTEPSRRELDDEEFVKAMSEGLFDSIPKPRDWRA